MAAKKCKCGRRLVLEMDKVRGRCYECLDHIFMKANQRSLWLSKSNAVNVMLSLASKMRLPVDVSNVASVGHPLKFPSPRRTKKNF